MNQHPPMTVAGRTLWALIAFAGFYVLTAIPMLFLFASHGLTFIVPFAVAFAAAGYVWLRADKRPESPARRIFGGAVLFGIIGFAAGFFGPLIFAPQANQGPLLGIFITGPVGILIGALAGLLYAFERPRRES